MFCFDNHLSRQLPTRFNSVLSPCLPYQIWVSRLWGLPRSTLLFPINYVTVALSGGLPRSTLLFPINYVTVALSGNRPWLPLGFFPPLRTPTYLALFFPLAQSLRASQLVRAWTFLYKSSDCPDRII